ncbi:MAG: ATP-binding protein [Candidatus Izemoplasma sp.]
MINISNTYQIKYNDIENAGTVASVTKGMLKKYGFSRTFIKRVTIGLYEAEINVTIHSLGGEVTIIITDDYVDITFSDKGPGIEDITIAMIEGFSTASSMAIENGFGAGMGLPNIKSVADEMDLDSSTAGTNLRIRFYVTSNKL